MWLIHILYDTISPCQLSTAIHIGLVLETVINPCVSTLVGDTS